MRGTKRVISVILCFAMMLTMFTAMPAFADAASVDALTGTVTLLPAEATQNVADGDTAFGRHIENGQYGSGARFTQGYASTLAWTVNVPVEKEGYYKLKGNLKTAQRSGGGDTWSYVVKVGETTYLDSTNNTNQTTSGNWNDDGTGFADYEAEYLQLAAGENTITLGLDYNKVNQGNNIIMLLKNIVLTFDAEKTTAEGADYKLLAKNATLEADGDATFDTYISDGRYNSGAYFKDGYDSKLVWTVNIPEGEDGCYDFSGNLATLIRTNGSDTWSFDVKVENELCTTTISSASNSFATTNSSWSNITFKDFAPGYVKLAEGENTITVGIKFTKGDSASATVPAAALSYITLDYNATKTEEDPLPAGPPTHKLLAKDATQEADGDGTFGTYISNGNYDYSAYFKDGYDSKLIWTVSVPEGEGGCYDFTGNLATLIRTNGSDTWSFEVKAENDICTTTISSADNSYATTNATWNNITFNDFAPGYVKLAEGENTITVGIKFTRGDSSSANVPAAALKHITLKYNATKTEEDPLPDAILPPSHTLLAKNATQEADGDGTFGAYISNGNYDHSAYFKDGYDSKLIWTVNVPEGEGGCYNFAGNLATLVRTNGSDTWSFDVRAENDICTTTISSANNSYPTTNSTWTNITFNDFAPGYVKLAEGENTITVGVKFTRGDSASTNVPAAALKHITLTYDADKTAEDPLPAPSLPPSHTLLAKNATQEAAAGDATFGTYIAQEKYNSSAYFRNGYASKLVWTVTIPEGEAGCYDLIGNAATLARSSGGDRWSFDINAENLLCTTTINNNSFETTNASWPTNPTFKDFEAGYVKLAEGENTITLGVTFNRAEPTGGYDPALALSHVTLKYNATKTEEDPLPDAPTPGPGPGTNPDPIPQPGNAIILDEDNTKNDPTKGVVTTNITSGSMIGNTVTASDAANGGSYYQLDYENKRPEITYSPKLESGRYEVFVNRPVLRNMTGAGRNGADYVQMTASISAKDGGKSVVYSNSTGSGKAGWYSLGAYEFSGTSSDKVVITSDELSVLNARIDSDASSPVDSVETASCIIDAVKFVPVTDISSVIDTVIIDETNRATINPSYTANIPTTAEFQAAEAEGYGYAHLYGGYYFNTWANTGFQANTGSIKGSESVLGGSYGGGNSATGSAPAYMLYYPRLNEGYYKVFVRRPTSVASTSTAPTMQATVTDKHGAEVTPQYSHADSVTDAWYELGIYEFSGIYGKDMVKVEKVTGALPTFDAVMFKRVATLDTAYLTVESPDLTAPSILKDSVFSIKSSMMLDKESITADTLKIVRKSDGVKAEADITVAENRLDITIEPKEFLKVGEVYTLVADGIKDKFGRDVTGLEEDFLIDLDTVRPEATLTYPANLSNVAVNSYFEISFSEDMLNLEKTTSYSIIGNGEEVEIDTLVSEENRKVKIYPMTELKSSTDYILVVNTGVTDFSENPVGGVNTFAFTTAAAAAATNILTASLANSSQIYETNTSQEFTINFSHIMSAVYATDKFVYFATDAGEKIATTVTYAGEKVFKVKPTASLERNTTYRIVVAPTIRSAEGYTLKDLTEFSIKTRFAEEIKTSVNVVTESLGKIAADEAVYVEFDTAIDLRTVNTDNITVTKGGSGVAVKISAISASCIGIQGAESLAAGAYELKLTPGIKSIEGYALSSDVTLNFSVVGETVTGYSATVSGTTAIGTAYYYNSSSATKTVTALLAVYSQGGIVNYKTETVTAEAGQTKPVSVSLTNAEAFPVGAYATLIIFDDINQLKPVSQTTGDTLSATLLSNSGVRVELTGSVSGNGKRQIVYTVVKKDAADNVLNAYSEDVIYIGTATSNVNGAFEIVYTMPNTAAYGKYTVKVGAEGVDAAKEFVFNNVSEYLEKNIKDAFNAAISTSDYATMETILSQNGEVFGVTSGVVSVLLALGNKTSILQTITSDEDCCKKIVTGIANSASNEAMLTIASDLANMAGISAEDAVAFKSSAAVALFVAARPASTAAVVAKNMRSAVAINKIKTSSTYEYAEILRIYSADLGITAPTTLSTTTATALYNMKDELTIANFVEKYNEACNTIPGDTGEEDGEDSDNLGGGGGGGGLGGDQNASTITNFGDDEVTIMPENTNDTANKNSIMQVFDDLADVEWAQIAISYLYKNGIINGVAPGVFAPNDKVTREQFIKMIVGAFNLPVTDLEMSFKDVPSGEWYTDVINAAVSAGIITGYSEDTFGVGDYITREDMATIMYRAALKLGLTIADIADVEFKDENQVSEHAAEAVKVLSAWGVMNGTGNNMFEPLSDSTRAMAAKMIYELLIR